MSGYDMSKAKGSAWQKCSQNDVGVYNGTSLAITATHSKSFNIHSEQLPIILKTFMKLKLLKKLG